MDKTKVTLGAQIKAIREGNGISFAEVACTPIENKKVLGKSFRRYVARAVCGKEALPGLLILQEGNAKSNSFDQHTIRLTCES